MKSRISVFSGIIVGMMLMQAVAGDIHTAVQAKDVNSVKAILQKDDKAVNAVAESGEVPLHLAAAVDSAEIVNLLAAAGAKINEVDVEGRTALHRAALMGCKQSADALLKRGIDWTLRTKQGATALQLAAWKKQIGVVQAIVSTTVAAYSDPLFSGGSDDDARASETASLFTRLRAIDPSPKINFACGMACLRAKDYPRARVSFEAVLTAEPGNERAKLELARAYHASGQFEEARAVFRDVLRRTTDRNVQSSIQAYLKQMESTEKKWFVGGSVVAGVLWDDNVNVGPNSEVVTIYPIEFGSVALAQLDITGDSQPLDSQGYSVASSVGLTHDGGDQGGWMSSIDGAFYNSWLADESDFNSRFYQVSAGYKYVGVDVLLGLPVRGGHIDVGGNALMNMYGVAPAYSVLFAQGGMPVTATTTFTLEVRDYDSLNDRDGYFLSAGQTLKGDFSEGRNSMTLGLQFAHDGPDAAVYEYNGVSWTFQMDFKLAWDMVLYGKLTRFRSSYTEREPLAPEDRKDTQSLMTLGLSKKVGNAMILDINVVTTRNESTFALYTYDRNIVTVSCLYTF